MINEKLILPCGVEVKNRFLKSAMTEGLAESDAIANKSHNKLYERWARSGLGISVTGNVSVKLDDNVAQIITEDFLAGTSANISIGDGSTIDFDIPTAKYTGHTHTNTDAGVFVDMPFMATANGSDALVTIDITS